MREPNQKQARHCSECDVTFLPRRRDQVTCRAPACAAARRNRQTLESHRRTKDPKYVRRRRKLNSPQYQDAVRGISVEEFLESRRPSWARDPSPAPDAWAGYDSFGGVEP